MTAPCSVCSSFESKYSCKTCKAPSCSLPCFKAHDSTCTAPSQLELLTTTAGELPPIPEPPKLSQVALEALFSKYPTLKSQLRGIYRTTLRPEAGDEEQEPSRGRFPQRGRGRGGAYQHQSARTNDASARYWTQEKGFDRGLRELQSALEKDDGENSSEGLGAFMTMILEGSGSKERDAGNNSLHS